MWTGGLFLYSTKGKEDNQGEKKSSSGKEAYIGGTGVGTATMWRKSRSPGKEEEKEREPHSKRVKNPSR